MCTFVYYFLFWTNGDFGGKVGFAPFLLHVLARCSAKGLVVRHDRVELYLFFAQYRVDGIVKVKDEAHVGRAAVVHVVAFVVA